LFGETQVVIVMVMAVMVVADAPTPFPMLPPRPVAIVADDDGSGTAIDRSCDIGSVVGNCWRSYG
jgi:hypothetical protein